MIAAARKGESPWVPADEHPNTKGFSSMKSGLSRRLVLAVGAGVAATAGMGWISVARAQSANAARRSISVRSATEFESCDPLYRRSPADGNVLRAAFQRLMIPKVNSAELELDAAAEVRQLSST